MPLLTRSGASAAVSSSPGSPEGARARRPPRFAVRVLLASFATVVLVLGAVIALLVYHARQAFELRVREELEAGHRLMASAQDERQRSATVQATVLSQSDALASAVEAYRSGGRLAGDDRRRVGAGAAGREGCREKGERHQRGGLAQATGAVCVLCGHG